MKKSKSLYRGHRFQAAVISGAVCWYFHFHLSLRDVEELLFERGVVVSYETIRRWRDKLGAGFARRVKVAVASLAPHGTSTRCSYAARRAIPAMASSRSAWHRAR